MSPEETAVSFFSTVAQNFAQNFLGGVFLTGAQLFLTSLTAALVIGIGVVLIKLRALNEAITEAQQLEESEPPVLVPKFSDKWELIRQKIASNNPNDYKVAVIEADAMLADVLDRMGFPGEGIGEQLKNAADNQIPNLQAVRAAHRLRNALAHDISMAVSQSEAGQAIGIYERALEDLRAI